MLSSILFHPELNELPHRKRCGIYYNYNVSFDSLRSLKDIFHFAIHPARKRAGILGVKNKISWEKVYYKSMRDEKDFKNQDKRVGRLRHSLAHLLAAAVLKKFPSAKLGIGPVIENGFYYDFKLPRPVSPEDLPELEKTMRDYVAARLPFTGKKVTPAAARKLFADQPFKLELIKDLVREKKPLTVYSTGTVFTDLCRGGHVKNTSEIPADAFALDRIAGAYWRGDEKKPQLTRVYGLAFETKKELGGYRARREEAERRDHKELGPQLDLFTFSELVGPGLPLWTPKGTLLRNILDDFVWHLRHQHGYQKVEIPHLAKKELYVKSGHWDKFKEELFRIITREGHEFAMKPMNCPHHVQIYVRRQWSYRELPQRYANTTMCYRDEQTGELAGLSRARSFTQDDAHVFCRLSQAKEELLKIWDVVHEFYSAIGFKLQLRVSLHDPNTPEKYLGDEKTWKEAEHILRTIAKENILRAITKEKKTDYYEAVGEAAFYGPKLDFMAKDSLGREWQVATIQLDMNMPERFDLTCTNEQGKPERIVMIHAAIMGSLERFLAIAIEHFAGAFPLWLAPVQATVVPVSAKFELYGAEVVKKLKDAGIRAEFSDPNETLGKRVREAELQKIPYVLVVGEREEKAGTVSVRHYRRGQEGEVKTEKLVEKIKEEITEKTL